MRRAPIRVDMEIAGAPGWVSGDVFWPDEGIALRPAVLFCFPGGGVTRRYFDIPGAGPFSFAQAMTSRGFVCVTFDHPGAGESAVPADGFALGAVEIAAAGAQAVARVALDLRQGEVAPALPRLGQFARIGVGHSMGAMIVSVQQAMAPLYDAAALLCFTTRGLPEMLTDDEKAVAASSARGAADYARLARARFGEPFPLIPQARAESPAAVALAQVQGRLAASCAMHSMIPGNIAPQAATLTVPLFVAAGDRDLTGPPHAIPASFPACLDMRLVVLPRTGHHPFVTEAAPRLYQCLAAWIETVPVPV